MKFKKVEISAFRIFTDQDKGEFDFTNTDGEAVDFVSIYAPNGFGKTSFYDAVEWCVTNNVQRFWQNEGLTKESLSSLGEISEEGKVRLLKNTKVADSVIPFVKIETDTEQLSRELRVHGNARNDIAAKASFEKGDFRQVILSQEWISSFLKESNGEHRYHIFMQNPALVELADYYKQVAALGPATRSLIAELQKAIHEKQAAIVILDEGDLLEAVNTLIIDLQKKGERHSQVALSASPKDVLDFNNQITDRVADLAAAQDRVGAYLRNIDEVKSALSIHFESIAKREDVVNAILQNRQVLIKFAQLQAHENDKNTKEGLRNVSAKEREELEKLVLQCNEYERVKTIIEQKTIEKNQAKAALNHAEGLLSQLSVDEQELLARLSGINETISSLETSINSLPDLTKDLQETENGFQQTENEIRRLNGEITGHRTTFEESERNQTPYLEAIIYLNARDYSNSHITSLADLTGDLALLVEKSKQLTELKQQQITAENNIQAQNEFSTTLRDFIQQGLVIANEQKTGTCPLCTSVFDSYEALVDKILHNNYLSLRTQELMQSLSSVQQKVNDRQKDITDIVISLSDACNKAIQNQQRVSEDAQKAIQSLEVKRAEQEQFNKGYRATFNAIQAILTGLSLNDYTQKLHTEKKIAETSKERVSLELQDAQHRIKLHKEEQNSANSKIAAIEKDITSQSLNEGFLSVLTWFKNNLPTTAVSKAVLETKMMELSANINSIFEQSKGIQNEIDALQNELAIYSQQHVTDILQVLEDERVELSSAILAFDSFFLRSFSFNAENVSMESLSNHLQSLEQSQKVAIDSNLALITEYRKLQEYNKNLMPFLQSENAKLEIRQLNRDVEELETIVLPYVEKERKSLQQFLEKQIEAYFYTTLINQIYKKIDPHPDFKEVKFISDFESENPRLDVFVTNSNDEQMLIPNLYFSTAQINILSLSIFLASALNSNNYDCIFVDDPIQSMDSINVLSTIDLIRGIVANQKKQVILSTHDSNFHNLLKKKIPQDHFKSKFIEFETFGKVKVD